MNRSRSGFTIVELLIVIVVIGILATITIVAYRGMQQRATTTAITSAVDHWEKAIRMKVAVSGELTATNTFVCLGSSIDDFPLTSDFQAGQCIRQVMNGTESSWSYVEGILDPWDVSIPSGLLPKSSLTLNGGSTRVQARGIIALSAPSSRVVHLQWVPQIANECGRGDSATPENGLSGGLCVLEIHY